MYYSYVETEYVARSFSPTRTGLALKLLKAIYLVFKTASRDAEEVIKVSSYFFLGFHQLRQCNRLENLSFSSLALVGVYWPQGKMMVQTLDASRSNLMVISLGD
jgi:hypothetical protein